MCSRHHTPAPTHPHQMYVAYKIHPPQLQHVKLRFQALMHMLAYIKHYDIHDIDRTAELNVWVDGPTTAMVMAQITGRTIITICPTNVRHYQHALWGIHNPWTTYPTSIFKPRASRTQQAPMVISHSQYANGIGSMEADNYKDRGLTLNHFIPVLQETGKTWEDCCERAIRTNNDYHPRYDDNYDRNYTATWDEILNHDIRHDTHGVTGQRQNTQTIRQHTPKTTAQTVASTQPGNYKTRSATAPKAWVTAQAGEATTGETTRDETAVRRQRHHNWQHQGLCNNRAQIAGQGDIMTYCRPPELHDNSHPTQTPPITANVPVPTTETRKPTNTET